MGCEMQIEWGLKMWDWEGNQRGKKQNLRMGVFLFFSPHEKCCHQQSLRATRVSLVFASKGKKHAGSSRSGTCFKVFQIGDIQQASLHSFSTFVQQMLAADKKKKVFSSWLIIWVCSYNALSMSENTYHPSTHDYNVFGLEKGTESGCGISKI